MKAIDRECGGFTGEYFVNALKNYNKVWKRFKKIYLL
jgi:hypothetical protein